MDAEPEPQRRIPRQARSRATQRRILDAAVATLTESGYEGFTTAAVSSRAGVSKGALFSHFSTREVLLAATTEHLIDQRREDFANMLSSVEGESVQQRVRAAICALYKYLSDPEYLAVTQVYSNARTNQKLAKALAPIAMRTTKTTHETGQELFRSFGVPDSVAIPGLVSAVFYAIEGMAMDSIWGEPISGTREQAFAHLERLILSVVPDDVR